MSIQTDDQQFTISLIGETSKEKWYGEFRALRRVGFRAQMERSRIRRALLGEHPQYATERDMELAVIFSDLAVSLTKAPKWWLEAGNGQNLEDDNLLREVWKNVMAIQGEVVAEEKKETKEASTTLKKAVENHEAEKPEDQNDERE